MNTQLKTVLSQPDHGGRFAVRHDSGVWLALFHRDALGRLVWTPRPDINAPCPFNETSELLDFKEDSKIGMPWDWTRKDLVKAIRYWLSEAPPEIASELSRLYPRGEPTMLPYLFANPIMASESDKDLLRVIETLEESAVDVSLRKRVLSKLELLGVTPIPPIGRFVPNYHEPEEGFDPVEWQPVEDAQVGWMRDGQALIKSIVRHR